MSERKEYIREGLEIDFDLLDSDLQRCYLIMDISWWEIPEPHMMWLEYYDEEGWTEGMDRNGKMMTRTLDNERELAEGRRMLRLMRYKSYACLADLAGREREEGEFVIRKPPRLGNPSYVCDIDETLMVVRSDDPDSEAFSDEETGFSESSDFEDAQRFTHAEAIRLTIRLMEVLAYDIPDDHGDYYEPMRADIAEELHARAIRRPQTRAILDAMVQDIDREP